jgi:di/tripeptidase
MTQHFSSSAAARFLRYVTFDTQSDERAETYPSTSNQLTLLNRLVDDQDMASPTRPSIDTAT